MKKQILSFAIALMGPLSWGQSVTKTMLRLPDTGQTGSFTATFGEDNDYLINVPYFNLNSALVATDTVTGLMWQRADGGEMTVENAAIYCDTLTVGGYTNWRLPNAHEAFSIMNLQRSNPSLDILVFTNTGAEYWWSATRQSNDNTKVWITNAGGGIGNHLKTETVSAGGTKKIHVRAVRDVKTPTTLPARFADNSNNTITDNLTGLVWEKMPLATTKTWEEALVYAEGLTLGGQSDWRLPNIKELQSINDESTVSPSLNATYFGSLGVKKYWSSTTLPNQTTRAWYWDTQFGITTYDLKTLANYVLCVRGGGANPISSVEETRKSKQVQVYPNPASNSLTVSFQNANKVSRRQVVLVNALGQLVFKQVLNNLTAVQTVDVSGVAKGSYSVIVTEGNQLSTFTVLIE
jgi:hypothetical protein